MDVVDPGNEKGRHSRAAMVTLGRGSQDNIGKQGAKAIGAGKKPACAKAPEPKGDRLEELVHAGNVQNGREVLGVHLCPAVKCHDAKSQRIEETLRSMAVWQLILYIRIKGGDVRRVT